MFGWSVARVVGDSMAPTLLDGDYVLARRHRGPLAAGAVVLVRHPSFGQIVKRILGRDPGGRYRVAGDNPLSTPSDAIGSLDGSLVRAVAWCRVSPSGVQRIGAGLPAVESGTPPDSSEGNR